MQEGGRGKRRLENGLDGGEGAREITEVGGEGRGDAGLRRRKRRGRFEEKEEERAVGLGEKFWGDRERRGKVEVH